MAASETDTIAKLLATIERLTERVIAQSQIIADLKRAGYEPPPPYAQVELPPSETLPEKIQDAIEARAFDRPGRQHLVDYAQRRMRETENDEELVQREILDGDPV